MSNPEKRAARLLKDLRALEFAHTFNPYSERCPVHDLAGAPGLREGLLRQMLNAALHCEVDSLWLGRDLGYRGGRRTGLAFTDDRHRAVHAGRWGLAAGAPPVREEVGERTAAAVWGVLQRLRRRVFLWNVFPLHPHRPGAPFSNRPHNVQERRAGEEFLAELLALLRPRRVVAIGACAAASAQRLCGRQRLIRVRHPSHGGQAEFLVQMKTLYSLC